MPVSLKQWVGHRVREAAVHVGRFAQPTRAKSIVFFPYTSRWVCGSVNLRVYELCAGLRALGWRTVIVPAQLEHAQRQRVLDLERPAVLVIQKSRHPLNRPHYYKTDALCVFDIDDADYANPSSTEQCRVCCEESDLVLAGSEHVAEWCRRHSSNVHVAWTLHPIPRERAVPASEQRAPVLAWAQSGSMAYAREAEIVQRIVLAARERTPFSFELFGVDDAAGAELFFEPFRAAGVPVIAHPFCKYPEFLRRLSRVAVGLHVISPDAAFSQGKSFGKVLAYLASDVAVVSSNVHENLRFFRQGETGMLCENVEQFADAAAMLLADPARRRAQTDAAYKDFCDRLSTDAIAAKVDTILAPMAAEHRSVRRIFVGDS